MTVCVEVSGAQAVIMVVVVVGAALWAYGIYRYTRPMKVKK